MEGAGTTSIRVDETPLVLYLLRRADDALVLGHRLSEWIGHGPVLEEEMALGNIGLDLIGQARSLYTYAAEVEGAGHDEDGFAYLREAGQYRNILLVEQPNGDFGVTMIRQFFYSAFADPYWRAMTRSSDPTLAAIAAKSEKESAYHLRHSAEWLVRLGDGTEESHQRARDAVDLLWPYTGEMFEFDAGERDLAQTGVATDPAVLRDVWGSTVGQVLARATLRVPEGRWMQSGGRSGRHSEHLGHLLSALQSSAADLSRRDVVSAPALAEDAALRERALRAVQTVCDPEIPVLTIADLGVLRDVLVRDGVVEVTITPTYSGCPAMTMIQFEIEMALERAGVAGGRVKLVLAPAWTTEWMTEDGRRKLREYGIAPPKPGTGRRALFGTEEVACPRCHSADTHVLSEFGSTSCKALWRCGACREPFDYFKCH